VVSLHTLLNLGTWSWDPTVIAGTISLAIAYAWLFRNKGGSSSWSPMGRIYFAAGLICLFLALESPIDVAGDHYLFSFHMLQHMILAMVVPPLLLLGLPERWRAFDRVRIPPIFANILFNAVLAVWHLPVLYEATLHYEFPLHVAEHLTFLGAGVVFWWPIMAPERSRAALSHLGKIAYLAFAGVPPTILGLYFILSPAVIYPFYAAAPRVLPLSPLEDQLLAGLVMFGLGNIIYFVAISVIFFKLDDKRATAGEVLAPAATRQG
jgi:putative membrane protein